jgi:hypothetical protein
MAYSRHKYSADLYKFVRETIGDTSVLKYYFVGNIALTAGLGTTGKMVIKTDEPIAIGSVISKIKDANGDLVLDNESWQVSGLEPVLNAFNAIESYRLKAVKFQGNL